jgi:hypothetical protein
MAMFTSGVPIGMENMQLPSSLTMLVPPRAGGGSSVVAVGMTTPGTAALRVAAGGSLAGAGATSVFAWPQFSQGEPRKGKYERKISKVAPSSGQTGEAERSQCRPRLGRVKNLCCEIFA